MHCSTGSTFDTVSDSSNQEYEKHSLHFRPCTHLVQTVGRGSACLISGRTKQNKLKRELKHTKVVAAATFEVEYHSQTEVTTACWSFSFCCRVSVSGAPQQSNNARSRQRWTASHGHRSPSNAASKHPTHQGLGSMDVVWSRMDQPLPVWHELDTLWCHSSYGTCVLCCPLLGMLVGSSSTWHW